MCLFGGGALAKMLTLGGACCIINLYESGLFQEALRILGHEIWTPAFILCRLMAANLFYRIIVFIDRPLRDPYYLWLLFPIRRALGSPN